MYTISRKVFGQYSRIAFKVGIPFVQNFPFQRLSEINNEKKHKYICGLTGVSAVKHHPAIQETQVWSLGLEDPLEKEMAIHSSILAWEIPRTGGVWQATVHGMERVRYDLVTKPLPYVCMQKVFHNKIVTEALFILLKSWKILIMSNNNC